MGIAALYETVTAHLYDFMIPLCALYVLRIAMCAAELGHMRRLRERKHAYHSVAKHYAEIACAGGMLVFGVLTCLLRSVWPAPFALMVAAGILGWRYGKRRGTAADDGYRVEAKALQTQGVTSPAIDTSFHGLVDTLDVYDKKPVSAASEESDGAQQSD